MRRALYIRMISLGAPTRLNVLAPYTYSTQAQTRADMISSATDLDQLQREINGESERGDVQGEVRNLSIRVRQ
jgi:hypothetical protein